MERELELFREQWKAEVKSKRKRDQVDVEIVKPCRLPIAVWNVWWEDIFRPCGKCQGKRCEHLSAEEIAPFWRLRPVCKQWRDDIDDWFKRGLFAVWNPYTHLNGLKNHRGAIVVENGKRQSIACLCMTVEYKKTLYSHIHKLIHIRGDYHVKEDRLVEKKTLDYAEFEKAKEEKNIID